MVMTYECRQDSSPGLLTLCSVLGAFGLQNVFPSFSQDASESSERDSVGFCAMLEGAKIGSEYV